MMQRTKQNVSGGVRWQCTLHLGGMEGAEVEKRQEVEKMKQERNTRQKAAQKVRQRLPRY
jgi:hypothetical protein